MEIMARKINVFSGVARGVAGVAEATPIFQFLSNRFGQKIWVKKSYLLQATPISKTYLPPCWDILSVSTNKNPVILRNSGIPNNQGS